MPDRPSPAGHHARHHADVTHYAILCWHEGAGYFAERPLEAACSRDAVIRDIADGQVEGVARVFAFNPAEHIADDVTEEIAIALARRCPPGEPITPAVRDFIEANVGLAYARGLAVDDRTFAAA
jgi:hypothetical protein